MYTFRFRSAPYPMLQNFDAPPGEAACVRRGASNTPLQALTTLNQITFVEAARALAERTMRQAGLNEGQRMEYAFRRCLTRRPSAAELDEMRRFWTEQREYFADQEEPALQLAAGEHADAYQAPTGMTAADAAAWTALCRVLLNLDETIAKP